MQSCVFYPHRSVVPDAFFLTQSAEEGGEGDEEEGEEEEGEGDEKGTPKGRKKIRKILKDDKLRSETQNALKEEEERRKRIAEKERLREQLREVNRFKPQWWICVKDCVKFVCVRLVKLSKKKRKRIVGAKY